MHALRLSLIIVLLGIALVFHTADCVKRLNRYLKHFLANITKKSEGMLTSMDWYEAMNQDSQRHSIQLDSSNDEPVVLRFHTIVTRGPQLEPSRTFCEDLIPPDENVTLGLPPEPYDPSVEKRIWVKPSWLHLKSMLLELAPYKFGTIRGFILQVRHNNTPIGRFRLGGSRLARGVQCPGGEPNNTIYFYRDLKITYRVLEWVPPTWFKANVDNATLHMTFITQPGKYWKLTEPTQLYLYVNVTVARDTYLADRQYYRTLIPKFVSWANSNMLRRLNVTITPAPIYHKYLHQLPHESSLERMQYFPNISKIPF